MKPLREMSPYELGESGQSEAIPFLIQFMEQGTANERRLAASAIRKLTEPFCSDAAVAIPFLLSLTKDKAPQVRQYALKALEVLTSHLLPSQLDFLESVLLKEDKDYNREIAERILSDRASLSPNSAPSAAMPHEERAAEKLTRSSEDLRLGIGHLFTTGPSLRYDKILHVAGIRFSYEHGPVSKDWIVNPGQSVTKRVYAKSRVSTALCQDQPSWNTLSPKEVTPFFENLDILFVFNLDHQLTWFKDIVLKGVEKPPVSIDLFAMAQFFLPDRTFYDLETLLAEKIPEQEWKRSDPRLPYLVRSFAALLQDVVSAILVQSHKGPERHLVFALLEWAISVEKVPRDFRLMYNIAAQAHRIRWSDDLFASSFDAPTPYPLASLDAKQLTTELTAHLPAQQEPARKHEDTKNEGKTLQRFRHFLQKPPSPEVPQPQSVKLEEIDQAFDKLSRDVAYIQPRPSQRDFARFCAEAVNEGGVYAIEAGTGTGKTLGYLVPACEFVRRNTGRKFVIVTATKNLQSQVIEQELPKLTTGKTLYPEVRGAILKGKSNYLCITALTDLFEDLCTPEAGSAKSRLAWLHLCLLVLRCGGELEGIPWDLKQRFPALFEFLEDVNAQVACVPDLCRLGNDCIYPRQLRQAERANIIVTNQHKLAFLGDPIRKRAAVCLIDEADQFPENFRSTIQAEISEVRLRRRFLSRIVGGRKRRGYAQILKERLRNDQEYANREETHKALETCLSSVERILGECHQVKTILKDIGKVPRVRYPGDYRWVKLRPVGAGEQLQERLKQLAIHFDRIAHQWDIILHSDRYRILEWTGAGSKKRDFLRREKNRIEKYCNLTREWKDKTEDIAADFPSPDFVHVFRREKRGWALAKIPFNIAKALETMLFKPFPATIFTSATLFVDNRLDLFAEELFLKQPFDNSIRISSPFEFERNVFGAVTTFIRPYRWNAPSAVKRKWMQEVTRTIAALAVAAYGRTLVLFTNIREMQNIFEQTRPVLERHDIEPLIQNGSSLAEINAFRVIEHSVLFGVDRFWTGVDFPGPTLSQVIVVRLPNPNVSDPLIEHRLEQQGEAFWEAYYHPVTKLKLKQGFGRLIRSEKDRGIFVVLDQRLVEDARMRGLQAELPISLRCFSQVRHQDADDLLDLAVQGLKTLGLHREFTERAIDLYAL